MELVHKFRTSPKLFSSVDASALAGILMVLLFVMMVPDEYRNYARMSVDLPKASHPIAMRDALREDTMMMIVTRDGRVYFGSDQINVSDLPIKIQDRLKDREVERKVYVKADMRAPWGRVKLALDGVRTAGIFRVAILADQGRLPQFSR
jgi:biopolymer transport protein TolR